MSVPLAFLRIRLLQVLRELKAAGPLYSLVLIVCFAAFIWFFYNSQKDVVSVIYWFSGITLMLVMVHLNRGDQRFIFLSTLYPILIYIAEYGFVMLMFAVLSALATESFYPFIFLLIVPFIALIRPGYYAVSYLARRVVFIESSNYEWLAGIRKSGLTIAALWLVGLLLTPVPYASLLVTWFLLLISSSFYELHENREMVDSFRLSSGRFLARKILQQMIPFLMLALPIMLLSIVFFPDRWWIWLLFVVFSCINIGVFVTSKYAIWEPGEVHRSSSLINSLCMVSIFVPFLLPLPLFVLFRNFNKAFHRLKPLLHAYHQ
jgi:hypothetical protein